MSSRASSAGTNVSSGRFVAPDFKRRQLIFDSFKKLREHNADTSSSSTVAGGKGTVLYGWGAGYNGQLGLDALRKKCKLKPSCIPPKVIKEPIVQIACGGFHTAVLTDSGRVFTWGHGRYGQLGNLARKHNMKATPRPVSRLTANIVSISCGQYHTVALSDRGELFSWGSGKYGQLGHNGRLDQRYPQKIKAPMGIGSFIAVSCGDRHTAAVTRKNQVVTFGSGKRGQLGHGDEQDWLLPKIVEALIHVKAVSVVAGSTTTCAITDTGQMYLWGFGESIHPKQLTNIVDTPRLVKMRKRVKQVACGQSHLLVLTEDGDVYAFGSSGMGQVGHGSDNNVRYPRLILKGKEVQQVACGRYHSMAVTAYGVLYSWGCGESGQLAHNSLENELFPRIVDDILPNVVGQVECGEHHTFCLASIKPSSVSKDVQTWKMIEDGERRFKMSMLTNKKEYKDAANGLRTKHVLMVVKERQRIMKDLSSKLEREKQTQESQLLEQLSTIEDRREIAEHVARELEEQEEHDRAQGDLQVRISQSQPRPNSARMTKHSSSQSIGTDDEDDDGIVIVDAESERAKRQMGVSQSTSALPPRHHADDPLAQSLGPGFVTRTPVPDSSEAGSPTSHGLSDEAYQRRLRVHKQLDKQTIAFTASHVDEDGAARHGLAATLPLPSEGASGDAVDGTRSAAALRMPSAMIDDYSGSDSGGDVAFGDEDAPVSARSAAAGGAMILRDDSTARKYQPLQSRVSFLEKTTNAMAVRKGKLQQTSMSEARVTSRELFDAKKEYNLLRAEAERRTRRLEKLRNEWVFLRPTAEDSMRLKASKKRVKELNMDLVTKNTRLMEEDENKRNYELYIIRMKEEDVEKSKKIDHLRQTGVDYDRLIAKMQRRFDRVNTQRQEIEAEKARFQRDIEEFAAFSRKQVAHYRNVLKHNREQRLRAQQSTSERDNVEDHKRQQRLSKLRQEYERTLEEANAVQQELHKWTQRVDYYEQRFHKITAATGLSRPEDIINKFFFNDEITEDLGREIKALDAQIEHLSAQKQELQRRVEEQKHSFVESKWRDVDALQKKQEDSQLRAHRQKEASDHAAQQLELVQEGLDSLLQAMRERFNDRKQRKSDTNEVSKKKKPSLQRLTQLERRLAALVEITHRQEKAIRRQAEKRAKASRRADAGIANTGRGLQKKRDSSRSDE